MPNPTQITYNETKLGELILYVAERMAEDPSFGATKLNKVLFFSDFLAYRRWAKPITGADYMKLQFGPAPRRLLPVQERLTAEGALQVVIRDGSAQKRSIALRQADVAMFEVRELELVDRVIGALRGVSAVRVSDFSHDQSVGWQIAGTKDSIPYNTVFLSPVAIAPSELALVRAAVAQFGLAA